MTDDDAPIGRVLTRRELLGVLAAGSLARFRGGPLGGSIRLPACVVRPEQTLGPYFVEERLNRSDIRSDPATGEVMPGSRLDIMFNVSRLRGGACELLPGAQVDIWQCDAQGRYSDVQDPGFNTVGRKFLRGHQLADDRGTARFITIYPGWYRGRTVHIHFKIRTTPAAARGYDFTSQLYFDDVLTDRVHAREPYAARGQRELRNRGDGIFRRGGERLLLPVTDAGDHYAGTFDIGLQID